MIEHDRFSNVRIEVELAFRAGRARPTARTSRSFDVLRATEYVVPALEILSSRIELQGRTIVDTISDNAAMGGDGPRRHAPSDPTTSTCAGSPAMLYRNETDRGVRASRGPCWTTRPLGVAWLANKLAQHGDRLEAGELVLAGSFTRPIWVHPGDTVLADYHDLGTITCRFV